MDNRPKHPAQLRQQLVRPLSDDFRLQPLRIDGHADSEGTSAKISKTPPWIPSYLTRTVLLTFAATFISFAIILVALFAYSSRNQGLSTVNDHEYYLWTYGPTAVLTSVAAFWAQVIYRTKQLMPWKAMAGKPQTATKSILLDYVSPMSPVVLWKAVSNRHHPVSLVVLSSVLLTATTVFSTGLLTLQYADVTRQGVALVVRNKFNVSAFDWTSVDVRPTAVIYGTLLGLNYPDGTTASYAVQDFTNEQGTNATLKATVDAFTAYLDCEEASLTVVNVSEYVRIGSQYTGGFVMNYTSPTCHADGVTFNTGPNFIFDSLKPRNQSYDTTFGFLRGGDCEERNETRVLFSAGTIHVVEHYNGSEYPGAVPDLPWDQMLRITNSTNLLCTPRYRIASSDVVKKHNATSGDMFESITQHDGPEGDAQVAVNFAHGMFNALYAPISAAEGFYVLGSGDIHLADTFFQLMTQQPTPARDSASGSEFWLKPENFRHYTNRLYGSLAAQIAAQKMLTPASASLLGSATTNEPRLFVAVLSFVLMEVGLLTLALIAVLLTKNTPRPFVLHDPGSISGVATVLAESPELRKLLTAKGAQATAIFESELGKHVYRTRTGANNRLGIEVPTTYVKENPTSASNTPGPVPIRWWRPTVLTTSMQLLAVLAPLAYIVVLEVLFALSQSRRGLTNVDTSSWTHYGWTYLPALAMICLNALYTSVAFNIRLLSPYAAMKAASVPASISVSDHPLSRIALHETFVTAKRKQFGVLALTIAALLAPFLTIAVSGLYSPERYRQDVAIRQLTTWNFDGSHVQNTTLVQKAFDEAQTLNPTNYSNGYYTAPFTELIVVANLSYPQWTFDELAFPLMQLENQTTSSSKSLTSLEGTLDLPSSAIRGVLNCSVIPQKDVIITYATWDSQPSAIYNETVNWNMAGNRQCLNFTAETGYIQNNGVYRPWPGCRLALVSTASTYTPNDCEITPRAVFLPPNTNESESFGYFQGMGFNAADNSYKCPWYVGMIGNMNATQIEDYTYFSCTTDVESVDTQITFTLPNYTISAVQINESTANMVSARVAIEVPEPGKNHSHEVNYTGTNTAMYGRKLALDPNGYLTNYNTSDGHNYDNFFSVLVSGRDGIPAIEMIGEANTARLLSAVQHLWRVYIAQQFRTSQFIISADPAHIKRFSPNQPLNGTLMDSNTYRLKQSEVSTRILQGFLAALSACAIVGSLLTDCRRAVLPRNPCSIAAVAALLAGSEMLDVMMAKNREGGDVEELRRWDGYFFSLGWWPTSLSGGGEKRFGVDIGKAERVASSESVGRACSEKRAFDIRGKRR